MSKILYFITSEDKTGIELAMENKDDKVSLVLMQNAVYTATKKESSISEILNQGKVIYASKKDVELRGIQKL
ncbi:MAG: DsrH/TusB family sulfur metabolism protein, partial [Candidatus Hodarchaeota archaeon]